MENVPPQSSTRIVRELREIREVIGLRKQKERVEQRGGDMKEAKGCRPAGGEKDSPKKSFKKKAPRDLASSR